MSNNLISIDTDLALLHAMVDIDILASGRPADLSRIKRVAEILADWMQGEPDIDIALPGLPEVLSEVTRRTMLTIDDVRFALGEIVAGLKKIDRGSDPVSLERGKKFCILFHRAFLAKMAEETGRRHYLVA